MKTFLKKNGFVVCLVVIFALAIVSRFVLIDYRAIHHDEGMLSYFAYKIVTDGSYTYTPQIHSPILFFVQAAIFKIFGTNTVRGSTALFGLILITIPLFFKKTLGNKTAITTASLILISPMFLYYSRFLVHSAIVVVFWFLTVIFLRRFFTSFRDRDLYLSAISLSLSFATSETTYIFLAILIAFIPVFYIFAKKKFLNYFKKISEFVKTNKVSIVNAVLIFIILWIAIYSVFFTNLKSLFISIPNPLDPNTGLGFWLSQNPHHLGNQKWYYYLDLLLLYEPIVILGGIFSIIGYVRSKNKPVFHLFLISWSMISVAGYSYAAEKFPWLILPALLPITILTGYYLGQNWSKFRLITKGLFIILAVFTVFNAYRLSFINSADPKELAVYVQTPQDFQKIADQVSTKCQDKGRDCVLIDQKISWPLSWTFYKTGTLFNSSDSSKLDATKSQVIFIDPTDYSKEHFDKDWNKSVVQLRTWWVPPICRKIECLRTFANYYLTRNIWGSYGGYDILILTKK